MFTFAFFGGFACRCCVSSLESRLVLVLVEVDDDDDDHAKMIDAARKFSNSF